MKSRRKYGRKGGKGKRDEGTNGCWKKRRKPWRRSRRKVK